MPFLAAVTQPDWLRTLRTFGYAGEVNFWRPGTQTLSGRHLGQPLLFVQKGRSPRPIAGMGIIVGHEVLPIGEAWDRWGKRSGVSSLEEFLARSRRLAQDTSANSGGVTNRIEGVNSRIGCVILRDVLLFPEGQMPSVEEILPDFERHVVSYKAYAGPLPALLLDSLMPSLAVSAAQRPAPPAADQNVQIEAHARPVCSDLFRDWQLIDVSTPHLALQHVGTSFPGFDMIARRGSVELHIGVKGTTLHPPTVTGTGHELRAAAFDSSARLFVVSGIQTYKTGDGWRAGGGRPVLYRWTDPGAVQAVLMGVRAGARHGLEPKTPEWDLEVDRSDLLQAIG